MENSNRVKLVGKFCPDRTIPCMPAIRSYYLICRDVDFKGLATKCDTECLLSLFNQKRLPALLDDESIKLRIKCEADGPYIQLATCLHVYYEPLAKVLPQFSENVWSMFAHILKADVAPLIQEVVTLFIINILYRLKRLEAIHVAYFYALCYNYWNNQSLGPHIYDYFRKIKLPLKNEPAKLVYRRYPFFEKSETYVKRCINSAENPYVKDMDIHTAMKRMKECRTGPVDYYEMVTVAQYYKLFHLTPTLEYTKLTDSKIIFDAICKTLEFEDPKAAALFNNMSNDIIISAFNNINISEESEPKKDSDDEMEEPPVLRAEVTWSVADVNAMALTADGVEPCEAEPSLEMMDLDAQTTVPVADGAETREYETEDTVPTELAESTVLNENDTESVTDDTSADFLNVEIAAPPVDADSQVQPIRRSSRSKAPSVAFMNHLEYVELKKASKTKQHGGRCHSPEKRSKSKRRRGMNALPHEREAEATIDTANGIATKECAETLSRYRRSSRFKVPSWKRGITVNYLHQEYLELKKAFKMRKPYRRRNVNITAILESGAKPMNPSEMEAPREQEAEYTESSTDTPSERIADGTATQDCVETLPNAMEMTVSDDHVIESMERATGNLTDAPLDIDDHVFDSVFAPEAASESLKPAEITVSPVNDNESVKHVADDLATTGVPLDIADPIVDDFDTSKTETEATNPAENTVPPVIDDEPVKDVFDNLATTDASLDIADGVADGLDTSELNDAESVKGISDNLAITDASLDIADPVVNDLDTSETVSESPKLAEKIISPANDDESVKDVSDNLATTDMAEHNVDGFDASDIKAEATNPDDIFVSYINDAESAVNVTDGMATNNLPDRVAKKRSSSSSTDECMQLSETDDPIPPKRIFIKEEIITEGGCDGDTPAPRCPVLLMDAEPRTSTDSEPTSPPPERTFLMGRSAKTGIQFKLKLLPA